MIRPSLSRIRRRLSATHYFGLQLLGGACALVLAGWLFGGIAEDVVNGDPLTVLDVQIARWFHAQATPAVTQWMLGISAVHGVAGVGILTTLVGLWFVRSRMWYWLLGLVLAVPGGLVLNTLVKLAVHRQRPSFRVPIVTLDSYSFPSGHTLAATAFYGVVAAFLLPRARTAAQRIAILVGALLMIALVALSRIYLGVHYLSDVVAAFAEGVAWLALCLMAVATLRRSRTPGDVGR